MSQPRGRAIPWPISAGVLAVGVVIVVIALATSQPPSDAGGTLATIQTGAPPWPANAVNLRGRLEADGLQVLTAEGQVQHTHQHLDLYVDGTPVTVPAGIGIDQAAGIISPIHTHDATGIIHVESPIVREFTLGELFDMWGVRFDAHCVGGACDGNGRVLSVYLNGQAVTGDPRSLVLQAHQEIVVAVGAATQLPSPIPTSYAFPAGD